MATFEMLGKTWEIKITAPLMDRLRKDSTIRTKDGKPVDLNEGLGETMAALEADLITLVQVLSFCCEKQCEARGVTPDQFAEGLCGDELEHATQALIDAVIDFFPSRRRMILQALRRRSEAATQAAIETLNDEATARKVDAEMRRRLQAAIDDWTQSSSATS